MAPIGLLALVALSVLAVKDAKGIKWKLLNVLIIFGFMGLGLGIGLGSARGERTLQSAPRPPYLSRKGLERLERSGAGDQIRCARTQIL